MRALTTGLHIGIAGCALAGILIGPEQALAAPKGDGSEPVGTCSHWSWVPARYTNTVAGDVVGLDLSPASVLAPIMQAIGEDYTHVQAIYDGGGARITHSQFDVNQIDSHTCTTPLDWFDLRNTPPGVQVGIVGDSVDTIWKGTVLEAAATPYCAPALSKLYQLHGLAAVMPNSTCTQFLTDSCGVSASPAPYTSAQIGAGAAAMFQAVYEQCMGTSWDGLQALICGSESAFCQSAANQSVNAILWNDGWCGTNYRYNCHGNNTSWRLSPSNPSGILPAMTTISPEMIIDQGVAQGKATHIANVAPGYYRCDSYNYNQCAAAPKVGEKNLNAYYAGQYDYYCGHYLRHNNGNDLGYCNVANSYAQAAQINTVATGRCTGGYEYNYQAGVNSWNCRYYEYWYGNSPTTNYYCGLADHYKTQGGCTQCGDAVCRPNCTGKTCGIADGCSGACEVGSGCVEARACSTGPQVGASNASALNAGMYDHYCGYYRHYFGVDFGTCQLAKTHAAAAGIRTTATGICGNGTQYNQQAGLNHWYCRYFENHGYGWNHNGYCTAADTASVNGNCNQCGENICLPSCTGKICGAANGCSGTCAAGSGCCTPTCAGKICGASNGCSGTCTAGSGCCTPSCSGKICGAEDGCGSYCGVGSGCSEPESSTYYWAKGWVDGYNTQHVWGWACDPDHPLESNRVDFWTTSGQYLGSTGAFHGSSEAISWQCLGGYAHYFDWWPAGGIPSGTHFNAWSIDLPANVGTMNAKCGGNGAIGDGTELVIP